MRARASSETTALAERICVGEWVDDCVGNRADDRICDSVGVRLYFISSFIRRKQKSRRYTPAKLRDKEHFRQRKEAAGSYHHVKW